MRGRRLPRAAPADLETLAFDLEKVDSANTFDAPNAVAPKPISVQARGGKLSLTLEPKSVTVISVDR